jgi:hypothetical protein
MSDRNENNNNANDHNDAVVIDEETIKDLTMRLETSKKNPEIFCPIRLYELFNKSIREQNGVQDVGLKEYVQAYEEINK